MSPPDQVRLRYPWQRRGAYCSLGAAAMSTILQAVLYRDEEQLSASWPSKDVARSFGAQRTRREPTSCSRTSEPQRGSSALIHCTPQQCEKRDNAGVAHADVAAKRGLAHGRGWKIGRACRRAKGATKGLHRQSDPPKHVFISALREAWHSRHWRPTS